MAEGFPLGVTEAKPDVPRFETSADGLSGETRERYLILSEQVEALKKQHGGVIAGADLSSAERLMIDEYNELRDLAFRNIQQAE